jgi:hypothetical protein
LSCSKKPGNAHDGVGILLAVPSYTGEPAEELASGAFYRLSTLNSGHALRSKSSSVIAPDRAELGTRRVSNERAAIASRDRGSMTIGRTTIA